MAGRTRTTKKLAQRIDLEYFKKLHTIPRWRRILSVAFTVVGVGWLGWHGVSGNPSPYNAGPLAHAHNMLGQKCDTCHTSQGIYQKAAVDKTCQGCHDGPIHHANETFTPSCMDCHVEHQGVTRLADTTDRACTQCHADLKTKGEPTKFATNISGFDKTHPEFTALRPGHSDPGTIKFNHQVHLDAKKGIRGPHGMVVLKCDDCHRAGAQDEKWPYGKVEVIPASLTTAPSAPVSMLPDRSYMEPVDYMKHCSDCHTLQFDKRFQESVPHKEPKVVYDFVLKKLTEYIAAHPDQIHVVDEPDKRIPARPVPPIPRNAQEWVAYKLSDAELLLWRKACKECHTLNYREGEKLPEVAKADVTVRWLQHGNFDHEAHQMVACASCHNKATASKETSDVLIPSVQVCRDCHHSGSNAAEARCYECHTYHDWSKQKRVNATLTVGQISH